MTFGPDAKALRGFDAGRRSGETAVSGTAVASLDPNWIDAMSFRPFTSESYAQDDRPEAWRDVLGAVGLQPASSGPFYDGHATASHRNATGLALTRISAGSQVVSPLPQSGDGLPIVLLPIEPHSWTPPIAPPLPPSNIPTVRSTRANAPPEISC